LNRNLVVWDIAFEDAWDGRGHYTRDTGEFACVCGLAGHMMPYINIGIRFVETLPQHDDNDYIDIFRNLGFLALAAIAAKEDIDIDNIFDNDAEEAEFAEMVQDRCFSAVFHKQTPAQVEECLASSLEGYF